MALISLSITVGIGGGGGRQPTQTGIAQPTRLPMIGVPHPRVTQRVQRDLPTVASGLLQVDDLLDGPDLALDPFPLYLEVSQELTQGGLP